VAVSGPLRVTVPAVLIGRRGRALRLWLNWPFDAVHAAFAAEMDIN